MESLAVTRKKGPLMPAPLFFLPLAAVEQTAGYFFTSNFVVSLYYYF